jgi:hypothetical protein
LRQRREAWRLGLSFYRDPLQLFLDLARKHGDIVHSRLGSWHFVLLGHPDLIEEVLVKRPRDFIKEHGHIRRRNQTSSPVPV